ncbi:hypothetical protein HAZT_HAZT009277 [Hyalella azteca]|uniref:Nuclear speckle splicing regulatory protein 1 N-terminal domain-containing protein n=1 Tax=Hyalella azteca TaxID=294128 RepID=A0A6A0H9U1_HYAAZ|nr:hypothetical protein HAZT_HAZT009277 [Hyalella azteca]
MGCVQPKYIGRILESARRRELERDRCSVRKLQKERQAEGSIFQDKESFVTPAYSKKLQEIREADARDIMQAKVEEKNEAKKDTNRASFYKNLFEQRVMGDVPVSDAVIPSDDRRVDDRRVDDQHPSDLRSPADRKTDIVPRDTSRSRSRSPHRKEVPENPTLREARRTETNKSNDSSERVEFRKIKTNKSGDKTNAKRLRRLEEECSESGNESPEANDHVNIKEEAASSSESETSVEEPTPSPAKVAETREQRVERLFAKRTVGDKFVEAQQRYLIRKAERENA